MIEAAIKAALPQDVAFAVSDPRAEEQGLWPEEKAYVVRAVDKRRREFAAGRRAARAALAQLGCTEQAILRRNSRAPIWPTGFTASLSHTDEACIAVAAKLSDYKALGVDIESAAPLDPALALEVTNPAERAWITDLSVEAAQVFSAKEAVYKCLCGKLEDIIAFNDLDIMPHNAGRFEATLKRSVGPYLAGSSFQVGQEKIDGFNFSFCFIR